MEFPEFGDAIMESRSRCRSSYRSTGQESSLQIEALYESPCYRISRETVVKGDPKSGKLEKDSEREVKAEAQPFPGPSRNNGLGRAGESARVTRKDDKDDKEDEDDIHLYQLRRSCIKLFTRLYPTSQSGLTFERESKYIPTECSESFTFTGESNKFSERLLLSTSIGNNNSHNKSAVNKSHNKQFNRMAPNRRSMPSISLSDSSEPESWNTMINRTSSSKCDSYHHSERVSNGNSTSSSTTAESKPVYINSAATINSSNHSAGTINKPVINTQINSDKMKNYTVDRNLADPWRCWPKLELITQIDPFETTDSMISAFACVANVINSDSADDDDDEDNSFDSMQSNHDSVDPPNHNHHPSVNTMSKVNGSIGLKKVHGSEYHDHLYETIYPSNIRIHREKYSNYQNNNTICQSFVQTDEANIDSKLDDGLNQSNGSTSYQSNVNNGSIDHYSSHQLRHSSSLVKPSSNDGRSPKDVIPTVKPSLSSSSQPSTVSANNQRLSSPSTLQQPCSVLQSSPSLPMSNGSEKPQKLAQSSCNSWHAPQSLPPITANENNLKPDQVYPNSINLPIISRANVRPTEEYATINKNRLNRDKVSHQKSLTLNGGEKIVTSNVSNKDDDKDDHIKAIDDDKDETDHHDNRPTETSKTISSATTKASSKVNKSSFFRRFFSLTNAISRTFSAEKIDGRSRFERTRSRSNVLKPSYSTPTLPSRSQESPSEDGPNEASSNGQTGKTSFVRAFKNRMSLRRSRRKVKVKVDLVKTKSDSRGSSKVVKDEEKNGKSNGCSGQSPDESDIWGSIVTVDGEESKTVEIHRGLGRHFGFFVARGTVNNIKGIFISRIDSIGEKAFRGLLEIGDRIVKIDGNDVSEASVVQVNQLMAGKVKLTLQLVPFIAHKSK